MEDLITPFIFTRMSTIKNLLFDLGGVFLPIDFKLTEQAFRELGVTHFGDQFNKYHSNSLFKDLETGKVTPAIFYERFRDENNLLLEDAVIQKAWNALILEFPAERIEWLKQIRKKYAVYLFSNTNQIHYDCFIDDFRQKTGQHFNDYFVKAYYSHEMGMRKPDPASFQYILKKEQLDPAETLFIDDTSKNTEAAAMLGMQTIHLQAPVTVLELAL